MAILPRNDKSNFLKRIVSRKENASLLKEMLNLVPTGVVIVDREGNLLLGKTLGEAEKALLLSNAEKITTISQNSLTSVSKFPIQTASDNLGLETLGWVVGDSSSESIAYLLNYLLNSDLEKKSLAIDGLEKYKEINLLYRVSSQLGSYLNIPAIADFVLQEASRLIISTSGCLLLINQAGDQLEKVAAFGQETYSSKAWEINLGIVGDIIAHDNAEIVNGVEQDSRFLPRDYPLGSLLCTALTVKGKVIGIIYISHESNITYTAGDLKLLIAIASQAAAAIDNALLHEHKLREELIKTNLGRYVASNVVEAIFDSKGEISLAPIKKDVTILFSDIRNFTTQCELLAPEQIVEYLNEYFTAMVEEIFSYGGSVNKFVGDMIVAIFGAPSHLENREQKAIETAIAMQKRLNLMPVDWIRNNFHTGIGISSGDVVVGNVGSPQHMDYTAIGDEVNIASRLQSLAKGGQILVSRSVYELNQDKFEFKSVGSLNVKGKHNAIEVFEVIY